MFLLSPGISARGDPKGVGLATWPENVANASLNMELGDAFGTAAVADETKVALIKEWFSNWPVY